MIARLRRQIAVLMVPLVFLSSVLYPARQAQAVVPVIAPIAMAIHGVGGAVLASEALTAAGTAILGGIAMAAIFSIGGDNPVTVRVPLQSDQAKTDAAMPAPSVPASVSPTSTPTYTYYVGNPFNMLAIASGSSALQACQNAAAACANTSEVWCVVASASESSCMLNWHHASGGETSAGGYGAWRSQSGTTETCPEGYSISGGSCALQNARLAQSDSKVDYTRSGAGYAVIPDTDGAKGAGSRQMVGGSVQVWGRDSSGAPVVVTTGVDANGNSTVQVQRGVTTAGGQSAVKSDVYVINGTSGAVQSAASTAAAGSISFDAASGAPVVTTGAAVTPTEGPSLQIPTDYNREATQQAMKDKVASIESKFAAGELAPVGPFDAAGFDPLKPDPGTVSTWVSSLMSKIGLPAGGQCGNAVLQSELLGKPISLSFVAFCTALAPIINWFSWVLVVFAVWRGVNRVTVGSSSEFVKG